MRARALIIGALLLFVACPAMAKPLRFGLVVGNNRGHDPARTLRFAERDARKFHDVMLQVGDFSSKNLLLMTGASAATVRGTLRAIERRIASLVKGSKASVLFLFYYSGHSEGGVLELGDSSLPLAEISRYLRSSRARVRLAFIDSCESGKLIKTKGRPQRVPAFALRVTDQLRSSGYAVVTSSAATELSQESEEIRGSFFTHYLVSGLRGAADRSGDRRITLNEAYEYAYSRTVAHTRAYRGGGQHPMYDFRLSGRGDLVLTDTLGYRSGIAVTSPEAARMLVLNKARTAVVAEANIPARRQVSLALPPGSYRIYLLSKNRAYRANGSVLKGKLTELDRKRHFRAERLRRAAAKGGLFRPLWVSRASVAGMLRRFPLGGQAFSYGALLTYRLHTPSGWHATARVVWSKAPDVEPSTGYWEIGGHLGGGYSWKLGIAQLRVEAVMGYEQLSQSDREGIARGTSAMAYLGSLGLTVPVGPLDLHLEGGAGGRLLELQGEGLSHLVDAQLLVGVGWRWGH